MLDTDELGLFNTPADMWVVAYAHGKLRFPICNTTAIISQPLLLMTMLNHRPYHPFPCPRLLWILSSGWAFPPATHPKVTPDAVSDGNIPTTGTSDACLH